jgi:hypothetical protein
MRHIKENNKITYIMNKNLITAANPTLGVRSYESPTVNVVEVVSEGVLCASGRLLETWVEEDNSDIWG